MLQGLLGVVVPHLLSRLELCRCHKVARVAGSPGSLCKHHAASPEIRSSHSFLVLSSTLEYLASGAGPVQLLRPTEVTYNRSDMKDLLDQGGEKEGKREREGGTWWGGRRQTKAGRVKERERGDRGPFLPGPWRQRPMMTSQVAKQPKSGLALQDL